MSSFNVENILTITVLSGLCIVYLYLLTAPNQPKVPSKTRNFVIQRDTQANFDTFLKDYKTYQSGESMWYKGIYDDGHSNDTFSHEWGAPGKADDFFLYGREGQTNNFGNEAASAPTGPNVPSTNYRCQEGWLAIRSEMNYKYLWMHTGENMWMGATATIDTPLHRKSFKLFPVNEGCVDGWVMLQEGDSKGFIFMVPPAKEGETVVDEWTVQIGNENVVETRNDTRYHFLVETDGYVLNRGALAFVNVMPQSEYAVRGHSSSWDRTTPAGREYGAMMHFQFINSTLVEEAIAKEEKEQREAIAKDQKYIATIAAFPVSSEKRVISFGLYGTKPKYTTGAIKNAELAPIYFPGWVCRFYVTSDVPPEVITQLKSLGAEIRDIPSGMGYISGMFWRFMVADDPTVDRYIVRDTDSRLNARDRIAVEDWIESKYSIHILRDHVNHCIVMNGGMWGGVKGAVKGMESKVNAWTSRDEYMADLHFLEQQVWPDIKQDQIAHDSYCCDRFPNARPYPTQRDMTYQHVGQVFDEHDNPRLMDIDGFIRGVPVPGSCRKHADWIYG